jgi:hypothetical protein
MSLKRVRAAALRTSKPHDFARRDPSRSFGVRVDSREALEVLVLRLGSIVRSADEVAVESGGGGGRGRVVGMVVLWRC